MLMDHHPAQQVPFSNPGIDKRAILHCYSGVASGACVSEVLIHYLCCMEKESGKYHQSRGEKEGEILPNKPGLTNPDEIHEAEAEGFARAELDAIEELTHETRFNASYIREVHRKALSHLYEFAGEYRSINMSKGGFMFAAAHVIPEAMKSFERDILLQMPHNYETRD